MFALPQGVTKHRTQNEFCSGMVNYGEVVIHFHYGVKLYTRGTYGAAQVPGALYPDMVGPAKALRRYIGGHYEVIFRPLRGAMGGRSLGGAAGVLLGRCLRRVGSRSTLCLLGCSDGPLSADKLH